METEEEEEIDTENMETKRSLGVGGGGLLCVPVSAVSHMWAVECVEGRILSFLKPGQKQRDRQRVRGTEEGTWTHTFLLTLETHAHRNTLTQTHTHKTRSLLCTLTQLLIANTLFTGLWTHHLRIRTYGPCFPSCSSGATRTSRGSPLSRGPPTTGLPRIELCGAPGQGGVQHTTASARRRELHSGYGSCWGLWWFLEPGAFWVRSKRSCWWSFTTITEDRCRPALQPWCLW